MNNLSVGLMIAALVVILIGAVVAVSVKYDECSAAGKVTARSIFWYECVSR